MSLWMTIHDRDRLTQADYFNFPPANCLAILSARNNTRSTFTSWHHLVPLSIGRFPVKTQPHKVSVLPVSTVVQPDRRRMLRARLRTWGRSGAPAVARQFPPGWAFSHELDFTEAGWFCSMTTGDLGEWDAQTGWRSKVSEETRSASFPIPRTRSQAAQQDTMELQQVNELRICLPVQCATLSLPLPRLFPASFSASLCAVSLF